MKRLQSARLYWFQEPLTWLLRCFFQPAGFKTDFEIDTLLGRQRIMLRLMAPIFLTVYPFVLLGRSALYMFLPSIYPMYIIHGNMLWQQSALCFVIDATWATAVSCIIGGFFGGLFSINYGITLAMSSALADGIIVNNMDEATVSIVFGLACGLIFGLTMNNVGAIKRSGIKVATLGIIFGIICGIVTGIVIGTFDGYWSGMMVGLLGGTRLENSDSILGSIVGLIVSAFAAALLLYIIGNVIRSALRERAEVIDAATKVGIAVACAFGAAVGIPVGDIGMKMQPINEAISTGLSQGLLVSLVFLLCYLPSYFRLPLYPLSALSVCRSYFNSRRDPIHVFHYLHHCALCCDECVFLPLPYVKQLLLLAAHQSLETALEEIDFIVLERPQQQTGAREAALEIALHDLSRRESLRDISRAHQRMAEILSREIRFTDRTVAEIFRYLDDASRDAVSYYSRVNLQARREALDSMLTNLKRVHPSAAFREPSLNRLLEDVINKWRVAAKQEQESVRRASANLRQIDNPYTPGMVLELRDPLFVGRQDLAQQLSEVLRRGRRPTFFLTGERRMGKSSVIKQLPDLLGSQYLPIFYDLQSTGVASSIAALLAAIAEGIYDLLTIKGMVVRELTYEQLRDNQRDNEAVVYHTFGRWLNEIERVLDREDRVLLLAFDEFEKLEEAGQKGHIDLDLLLDWFRSVIQNRSRIALLFSGVKMVSEMGMNWSGYFVNVETLKVSYLRPEEARHLIIHPVANFPGEHIFSEEVVDRIIGVTGCHPFLLQAICSNVVVHLNAHGRQRATPGDVTRAEEELFERWGDHYFNDMWSRTDDEQRTCLLTLCRLEKSSFTLLQQSCSMDAATTQRALQKLIKRDIVLYDQEMYRIAAPIFEKWIRQSV